MQLDFEIEGATSQCICVISRSGVEMCRLSTTCSDSDRGHQRVAEMARGWIADFLGRAPLAAAPQPMGSGESNEKRPAPNQPTGFRG